MATALCYPSPIAIPVIPIYPITINGDFKVVYVTFMDWVLKLRIMPINYQRFGTRLGLNTATISQIPVNLYVHFESGKYEIKPNS